MPFRTVAFVASEHEDAQKARARMLAACRHEMPEKADVIVALGGDGFMLETLHRYMHRNVPIYGMNRGSVGFLMNVYDEERLFDRLASAEEYKLKPLHMTATHHRRQHPRGARHQRGLAAPFDPTGRQAAH